MDPTRRSTQVPGYYRLNLGAFSITVLNDGWLSLETSNFSGEAAGAAALLEAAFLPTEATVTAVNAWLIEADGKLILVDTGASNALTLNMGRLAGNLAASGIEPGMIDMVVLTHMHPDHLGGLLTPEDEPAFPNATLHVNAAEYAFWTADENYQRASERFEFYFTIAHAAIQPYRKRLVTFTDGAELAPGIQAVTAPGHTVGHTMLRLFSGGDQLLIWGDLVHNAALQFPEPERGAVYDTDGDLARATRKRVLDMAARDRLLIAGSHLPFPGIGHVAQAGNGFAYVPIPWSAVP